MEFNFWKLFFDKAENSVLVEFDGWWFCIISRFDEPEIYVSLETSCEVSPTHLLNGGWYPLTF